MYKIKVLPVVLFFLFFVSCLDINEEVTINQNGSGKYSSTIDLSQLIEMMQSFGGDEITKGKEEKIDTAIELKTYVDTSTSLSPEQKALLRKGRVRLKMNIKEKVFDISTYFPFNNMENLQQINSLFAEEGTIMSSALKNVLGNKKDTGSYQQDSVGAEKHWNPGNGLSMLTSVFDFNCSNGLIKKNVNPEKLKTLMDKPQMDQLKQSADMGIEVLYSTTYNLPRPVKKVTDSTAKISADKKTVTIRQNLMELFTKSEKFNYTIEY